MSLNEVHDLVQFAVIEPIIGRQSHGIQPELGFITAGFDVDVGWLLSLVAEKEEAVRSHPQHSWHSTEPSRLKIDPASQSYHT